MTVEWLIVLSPLISLLINCLTQILTAHLFQRTGLSILIGLICGLILSITILATFFGTSPGTSLLDICLSIITYLTLSFCYWASINLNITSLRIRLIRELFKQPAGLNSATLLERYSAEELINRRIQRLADSRQIIKDGERWKLNFNSLLYIAYTLTFLRKIIIASE